jgi:hypothetical protein
MPTQAFHGAVLAVATALSLVPTVQPPVEAQSSAARAAQERRITFNGRALDTPGWRVLEQLETHGRTRLPDGAY